jgi:predicted nucleic acid-binding protein
VIVISDTSPINYLCRIGQINILPTLFQRVIVPPAVVDELSAAAAPVIVREFVERLPAWCEIRTPQSIDHALVGFGAGELEAISLAQELNAELLIVDDHGARLLAMGKGIRCAGVLGVLKLAAERQLLDFPRALDELLKSGFYVSDGVLQRVRTDRIS